MLKPIAFALLGSTLAAAGCNNDVPEPGAAGAAGSSGAGSSGAAGSSYAGQATAGSGGAAGGSAGVGGVGGSAGSPLGGAGGAAAGAGGAAAGAGGAAAGQSGTAGAGGSINNVPADYKGTPFTTLQIPGKINAADYDRGGAGVAWCHDTGNCGAGIVTGDYPGGSGVYRPAMPPTAKLCSGAACDDNVGVCRMNPSKPDNTIAGQPMPATDTYLCYSVVGEWTKYTVQVAQPGMYSISGVMAVPPDGGGATLSFGPDIKTSNLAFAVTPNTSSGSGENYHSWDDRKNLATISFPAAGSYVLTLTQTKRFNASSFTFTKL